MRKVKFRDWEFEVDFELTQKTFKNEIVGASENCDCGNCKNFSEQKTSSYPQEIKILFEKLGIDFNKEDEVSEVYKKENGLHNYIGWFHFAGKILSGKKCNDNQSNAIELSNITENFSIGFCEDKDSIKRKNSFVKIWFETDIPYILDY